MASCPMICVLCYSGLGKVVVLRFLFCVIEDLKVSCPILCYLCYRGIGGLVVLCFEFCVIVDLEG
jgi:hypothetical protein